MLHRRDAMIRLGEVGLGGIALPGLLQAEQTTRSVTRPKAKSCIVLFLWGGPSQPDMWDMKPNAPEGIRSPFKPIQTAVPGTHFGALLPQSAAVADKFSIIRSMSHDSN